jgi:N-acyl-D-aspartate/D-glutamate deacylase
MPLAEAEFEVMVAMSKAAQSPMNWNVIQVRESNRERVNERLEVGRRALEKGARIVMLVMPQPFAVQFTFRTGFVLDAFPGWKDVMSLPPADKLRVLCDQSARRRLERLAAQDDGRKSMAQWESHVIVETFTPETKQYEGRIVGDIAREQGKTPFDALLDIVIRDDLWTYFRPTATEESHDDWVFRAEVCRDHRSLIGASDAGAHLDMMATQDYTANVLANFVRRHNVMTLEEAVHLISEAPAKLYGLQGRGLLQEGSYGDVVIFDENTIDSTPWAKRTDLPGGASRLYTEGVGIDHVFVNGREVVNHGEFNENRPGVLLHSGRDTYDPPMVL